MDGQGDRWPVVDGTLTHLSAPVSQRLSPAPAFRTEGSSPKCHSGFPRNDKDTAGIFKQPQQDPSSLCPNLSLSTQVPDFANLHWESAEQVSSDPLATSPSLLNLENPVDADSEDNSAEYQESNDRPEPVTCEDDASWPIDILSSDSQSAQGDRIDDVCNQSIPAKKDASLADKLLFSTPTAGESNKTVIAQSTSNVAPVSPFSQFTMQAPESSGRYTQDFSLAVEYDGQVTEPTNGANPCHTSTTAGCNPVKTGQSIPMQSSLLSTMHKASSQVLSVSPTPQHCHPSSDYVTPPDQPSQDFSSAKAKWSDQDVGVEKAESRINDDFSLICDPPSFSDSDDCDIRSPDLTADITRICDNAQQWCSDSSNVQGEEHSSGMKTASDCIPSLPVPPIHSFKDTIKSSKPLRELFDTQKEFNADAESNLISMSNTESVINSALLQLDSVNENESVPVDTTNDLVLEEQDTYFSQNSSFSAIMTSSDVLPTQKVTEKSCCEAELESKPTPKTCDDSMTASALLHLDSNYKGDGVPRDNQSDVRLEEQDMCCSQTSRRSSVIIISSDVQPSQKVAEKSSCETEPGTELTPKTCDDSATESALLQPDSNDHTTDGSVSSEESVLLISDIEFDAKATNDKKEYMPIQMKTENLTLPVDTCQNELFARAEPDSTTHDQDDQVETSHDARMERSGEEEGFLMVGENPCDDSSSLDLNPGTGVHDERCSATPENASSDETRPGDKNKDSSREDTTTNVEMARDSSKNKEIPSENETAVEDSNSDVEKAEAKPEVSNHSDDPLEENNCKSDMQKKHIFEDKLPPEEWNSSKDGESMKGSNENETKSVPEGNTCREECEVEIIRECCITDKAHGKDDTDAAKCQSGDRDVSKSGAAAWSHDLQAEKGINFESAKKSVGDREKSTEGKTNNNQGRGLFQGSKEHGSSLNPNLLKKTADASLPADDVPIFDVDADSTLTGKETDAKNLNSQEPEKEKEKDGGDSDDDDDVLIIDEDDPEVIILGSSDEDEAPENTPSKSRQPTTATSPGIRSAANKNPSLVTANKQPMKNAEWACHICGDRSKTLNSLKLHVRRVHNLIMVHRKEDMKCKLCSFKGTWQKIKDHIIKDHETPLKWYIKNHETREITKLPLSTSSPLETQETSSGKKAIGEQSSHTCEANTQKPLIPVVKQHYLIKKVSNIGGQSKSTSDIRNLTKEKPMSLTSPSSTSASSLSKDSVSIHPGVSVSTSKMGSVTRDSMPGQGKQVALCNQQNIIILRHSASQAITTTTSVETSGQGAVINQGGLSKPQVLFSHPTFPGVIQVRHTATPAPTVVRAQVGNTTCIMSPVNQTGVQQKVIQLSTSVTQHSSEPIVYRTNAGKQYQLVTTPKSTQQQVKSVLGGISATPSEFGHPQRFTQPKSFQVTQKVVRVSEMSKAVTQQPTQTILRFVSNQNVQGSIKMSAAKALLNAICSSSKTDGNTGIAPLPKAKVTYSVPTLEKQNVIRVSAPSGKGIQLSKSVISSLPGNWTSTSVPTTATIIKTKQTSVNLPHSATAPSHSSTALATAHKAQTVTTQSLGPVTSCEASRKITVQQTVSDGSLMASYLIKVPRSLSDSSEYSNSSDGKRVEDCRSYLVKVPVNQTNSPKKFMVHLPVDKDSTVKHAVCIVQPPAAESDGTRQSSPMVLGKISNSVSSENTTQNPNSHWDSPKSTFGQRGSVTAGFVDARTTVNNVHGLVPLSIRKARGDPSKKAECVAHLQEPAVDISLLESQFKDSKVFKAADLIKVDDRVQYECARCKEAFPQLMLLQLHHIDCTAHPPSHKILPIVHIPTALLAAFFSLSSSGYSSTCAICKVLLLGNARNVEDQQDFASHLAKHTTEPHVAITCLDDTRKLGILQTRMTSQQAREWVDYIVPPFKMWNRPTSAWDGSLGKYVCTEGILHRESLKCHKRKRSLSPMMEKSQKHKKHKKHKRHKYMYHDIAVHDGTSKEGSRNQYQSALKTAEGCEGEWVEPSPKTAGKLLIRNKPRSGGLKESIMRSPSQPKLLPHGLRANASKHNKASPSKASQRFLTVKIPGRRSLRGLGLDFGQGLMMLPMTTRRNTKKMHQDGAEKQATGIHTEKMNVGATPSCSAIRDQEVVSIDDCDKKSTEPVGRQSKKEPASNVHNVDVVKAQKGNFKIGADKKDHIEDIVVIISSDDDDDDDIKDDTRHDEGFLHARKTEDGKKHLKTADIVSVEAVDESDSKDADFSDNPDDDGDSSSDEDSADEQQSDIDDFEEEADEDRDEITQRDIPLTMMALHYQRLNEEVAKSDQEEHGSEDETSKSPIHKLSEDNHLMEGSETPATVGATRNQSTVKRSDTIEQLTTAKAVHADNADSNLPEDHSSIESALPSQDDGSNSSEDYSLERSNSVLLESNSDSNNMLSLESVESQQDETAKQNTSASQISNLSDIDLSKNTESKKERSITLDSDSLLSEPSRDSDFEPTGSLSSKMLEERENHISSHGKSVNDDVFDSDVSDVSDGGNHESSMVHIQEEDSSCHSFLKDTTSDARILDDLRKNDDEISVEGSISSWGSDRERCISTEDSMFETNIQEDCHSKDSAPEVKVLDEQKLGNRLFEDDNEDDEILDYTQQDSPPEDSILEDDALDADNLSRQDHTQKDYTDSPEETTPKGILECDSSRDDTFEERVSERKSRTDEILKDDTIKESIQNDTSLQGCVSQTEIQDEDIPININQKIDSETNSIPADGVTEDSLQNKVSEDESGQRDSCLVDKNQWDSPSESPVQQDRFFQEKNQTSKNILDGSQTDETVEQVSSEEESSDVNETSQRDRFFSERSIDLADHLGSRRNDRTPEDGVADDGGPVVSSIDEEDSLQDVFRDEESSCSIFRKVSDGDEDIEGEENVFHSMGTGPGQGDDQDDEDDEDDEDDIICLFDDSDEEEVGTLFASDDHSTFKPSPVSITKNPPCQTSSASCSPEPPSETQASKCNNLKRKPSPDLEEEEEEEEYHSKRSRGENDLPGLSPSDCWNLLEASEESEDNSDAETVWKRDRGASVFTQEEVGQLRAGGL